MLMDRRSSEIIASAAIFSLVSITAPLATCGWHRPKILITVLVAVSVALVVARTSNIAMTVECVSMLCSSTITIARLGNLCQIAPSARRICSRVDAHLTKCPAAMPFIGNASAS